MLIPDQASMLFGYCKVSILDECWKVSLASHNRNLTLSGSVPLRVGSYIT